MTTLTRVLNQSDHIRALMTQAAEELSVVSTTIKEGLANGNPVNQVANALEKTNAVKEKLQEAVEKLTSVNRTLENEVRERAMVDLRFAAAVEQEASARNAAFHDVLTGLPNRALFHDRLEHGIAQAKRNRWTLAVMFIDLDGFKSLNDSYGHQAGDFLLQTVATRLKETTREDDTVSRHGGDEFLYLLTQIHEQKDVSMIAAKILSAIKVPCDVGAGDLLMNLSVAASIGIAIFPQNGATADTLIASADAAMYRAKLAKSGYAFAQ